MIYLTDCSVPIKSIIDYVVSLYQVRIQVVSSRWVTLVILGQPWNCQNFNLITERHTDFRTDRAPGTPGH